MKLLGRSEGSCEKCLFREMDDHEYLRYIQNYLDTMDQDNRVSDKEYDKRLNNCRNCQYLRNGMCRLCGCFVEIRCASKNRYCPDTSPKW